jgi:hypothetical protein
MHALGQVDFGHVTHGLISGPTFTRSPNHVLELGCDHCELSHIRSDRTKRPWSDRIVGQAQGL